MLISIDGEEQNKSKDQDESNSTYDIRVRGGYILSVLYDGRREESDIIVLDADNIALGPIARVPTLDVLHRLVRHVGHWRRSAGEQDLLIRWKVEGICGMRLRVTFLD